LIFGPHAGTIVGVREQADEGRRGPARAAADPQGFHDDVEFLRSAYGLLPAVGDRDPGAATCMPLRSDERGRPWRSCTCRAAKRTGCRHLRRLETLIAELHAADGPEPAGRFLASFWHRLGEDLFRGDPVECSAVLYRRIDDDHVFLSPRGTELARWLGDSPGAVRFRDRWGEIPGAGGAERARLLDKLGKIVCNDSERALNNAGHRSQRQAYEASFWGRLAYHGFREYGDGGVTFRPAIDGGTGEFTLVGHDTEGRAFVRLGVARSRVRRLLDRLAAEFGERTGMTIHPVPLRSIFEVTRTTELDLEVRPMIEALQVSGERRFFERADLAKFTYGDLVYVPELEILAELERPGHERRFRAPVAMKLARSQVPQFLERHRREIDEGSVLLASSFEALTPLERPDRMEIVVSSAAGAERGWYRLALAYGFGGRDVQLDELLRARAEGQPFLDTVAGWVDLQAPFFGRLAPLAGRHDVSSTPEGLRLSAPEVLRLTCAVDCPVEVKGRSHDARRLRRLVALEPSESPGAPAGLATPLRDYQRLGLDWLSFLSENRLGGLLCDDMGLGKTHQAMALMLWLRERRQATDPFLVICPTTVISHWRDKLRAHAPGLRVELYHGTDREAIAPGRADVLLTSYGILRNDVERLAAIRFGVVIFDEIQHLKNKDTRSYKAALRLETPMKLGLTGTPIENSLGELKALFDLVLPGYLGSDAAFERDYAAPEETARTTPGGPDPERVGARLTELRRMIRPFVLRRLKTAVLDELPDKIEDVRTCRLSDEQLTLYRDALASRGSPLVERLRSAPRSGEPLPYLHVFALLTLLKQICDHPALVRGGAERTEGAERSRSGKWDLFQELLFESLDSGQKVVVFTQFLGMIAMMERLLRGLGVEFVRLSGASRERGEIVRRFNEDAACRVFLGSLKAGGTGIDLVAGSVVIHYDRWWNAAREDQATDRVHRIGQKRGVQVFKLVTEETLEERISAIIDGKRRLMNAVVRADDPKLSKVFTREELIELLEPV
jgi:superfamily II DNA or RNA helicase